MAFLLVILIVVAYYAGRPKQDFYLIEVRYWSTQLLKPHARNYIGYSKKYQKKTTLKIYSKGKSHVVLMHSNQGMIKIEQFVFSSLPAAQIYFESLKPRATNPAVEMYLWRTVARSRNQAFILPPSPYVGRGTVLLCSHRHNFVEEPPQFGAEFSRV
ncbi:hypothetical protein [Janthinobacterium sp. PSPC3-1]|uniref:hypothetical protein n=1 Tax=Janthinobacterium sp. PSPC3-1 TaxID=2804653 RepID=UPI003CEEAB38